MIFFVICRIRLFIKLLINRFNIGKWKKGWSPYKPHNKGKKTTNLLAGVPRTSLDREIDLPFHTDAILYIYIYNTGKLKRDWAPCEIIQSKSKNKTILLVKPSCWRDHITKFRVRSGFAFSYRCYFYIYRFNIGKLKREWEQCETTRSKSKNHHPVGENAADKSGNSFCLFMQMVILNSALATNVR